MCSAKLNMYSRSPLFFAELGARTNRHGDRKCKDGKRVSRSSATITIGMNNVILSPVARFKRYRAVVWEQGDITGVNRMHRTIILWTFVCRPYYMVAMCTQIFT